LVGFGNIDGMTRGIAALTAALVMGVAGMSPALATSRMASDREADHSGHYRQAPVPLDVQGQGFGHGIGMSQYGALGRANAGDTWKQILGFYYPGTRLGDAGGKIRVLLTGDASTDVKVRARSGLTAQSLGTGKTWRLPATLDGRKVSQWRITPDGTRSQIAAKTHRWHDWKSARGEAQLAADGAPVTLLTPDGAHAYRGALRSAVPDTGKGRDTVNVVPLESYVKGVVPSEVPALWPDDAVAAQAVAARTYAVRERADNGSRYYDLCDTPHCQVYAGVGGEHPDANDDISRTKGRVVTYGGQPAFTQFSASNGGYTVDGGEDYLVAQADPKDGYPAWTTTVDAAKLSDLRPTIGDFESVVVTGRDGHGAYGGRVTSMLVHGSNGDATITGDDFRIFYGLKSSLFRLP
jgi:stage II sporulation protein D